MLKCLCHLIYNWEIILQPNNSVQIYAQLFICGFY